MTLIDGELLGCFLDFFIPFMLIGMAAVIAVATPYLASGYPVLLFILYLLQVLSSNISSNAVFGSGSEEPALYFYLQYVLPLFETDTRPLVLISSTTSKASLLSTPSIVVSPNSFASSCK
jgi:hypothetical protein